MRHQLFQIMAWSAAIVFALIIAMGLVSNSSYANAAASSVEPATDKDQAKPTIAPTITPTRISLLSPAKPRSVVVHSETKKWVVFGEHRVRSDVVDIRLGMFTRPADDNGRGLHWFPTMAQKPEVVDRFVPELKAMKIRWLVILQGVEDWHLHSNDYLVERLNDAGIVPLMRIEARVGALDLEKLRRVVVHYRARGVQYFQVFNEPNAQQEWSGVEHPTPELFLQHWIPAAEIVAQNGGLPGLAPLIPMPNRTDELFLDNELRLLVRAGRYDLINVMWLAIHNYGGMDDLGFLRYCRYAAISKSALGQHLPLLSTEGGAGDASASADTVVSAFEQMEVREPWFLAYSPWLIGNGIGGGRDETWESQAWFQRNGALPIVDRVKSLP